MDAFNENSNEQQAQQPMGCLHRFSKTIKVVIIGLLILLLMIPMFMIENLISERGRTQEEAIDEASRRQDCESGRPSCGQVGGQYGRRAGIDHAGRA